MFKVSFVTKALGGDNAQTYSIYSESVATIQCMTREYMGLVCNVHYKNEAVTQIINPDIIGYEKQEVECTNGVDLRDYSDGGK